MHHCWHHHLNAFRMTRIFFEQVFSVIHKDFHQQQLKEYTGISQFLLTTKGLVFVLKISVKHAANYYNNKMSILSFSSENTLQKLVEKNNFLTMVSGRSRVRLYSLGMWWEVPKMWVFPFSFSFSWKTKNYYSINEHKLYWKSELVRKC